MLRHERDARANFRLYDILLEHLRNACILLRLNKKNLLEPNGVSVPLVPLGLDDIASA